MKDLESAGIINEPKTFKFNYDNVDRQHESYFGMNISLHYFVRVTILRSLNLHITKQVEFFQRMFTVSFWFSSSYEHERILFFFFSQVAPENTGNIKMEVGIEDCLHIEFEYNKSKFVLLTFLSSPLDHRISKKKKKKIPPQRCHHWQNLFLGCSSQNKIHEYFSYQEGNNRNRSEWFFGIALSFYLFFLN